MPPRPLDLLSSGSRRPQRSEYQTLTPRTPHSRSGRAEEALTDAELEELKSGDAGQYLSYRQHQSEPLLQSSSSTVFPASGYRSRGDDQPNLPSKAKGWKKFTSPRAILQNIPLSLGCLFAALIFAMYIISLKRPGALERFLGFNPVLRLPTTKGAISSAPASPSPPTPSFVDTAPPPNRLISYSNRTKFPLTGVQYREECDKLMGGWMHHSGSYWSVPPGGAMDVAHHDDVTDYRLPEGEITKVCSKTITYQLDGTVGIAADLALMAQVAGLARERNRTFFVDDTYWNRGKWTDHFQDIRARQPGPERGCRAPPPEELVACPRVARHWVVNSRTAKYHLGHAYSEQYEDPYSHEVNRLKPIFDRALESFTQTIRPNAHNAELIRSARNEISATLSLPPHPTPLDPDAHPTAVPDAETLLAQHHTDPYIAVHIRRGDRHAANFPYRGKYVPLDHYVSATKDAWARLYSSESTYSTHYPSPPITYIASDSPESLTEFVKSFPSSTAVFALDMSTNHELKALAPKHEYFQEGFDNEDEDERIRLTRGAIVDFAMVSGMWAWEGDVLPGATVCTITSSFCKLSAVGLGWDRAFGFGDGKDHSDGDINDKRKRWIEIDNRGIVTPEWAAFELF